MYKTTIFLFLWLSSVIAIYLSDSVWYRPSTIAIGEYNLPMSSFPEDLNTATAYNSGSYLLLNQIVKAPLAYQKISNQLTLVPQAVKSHTKSTFESSDLLMTDELTKHHFTLKEASYSSHALLEGQDRKIKAEDFLFQIARMADPKIPCPIKAQLREGLICFEYLEKLLEKTPLENINFKNIIGIEYDSDSFTLISHESFKLEQWMTLPFFAPYPQRAYQNFKKASTYQIEHTFPISNGDFSLKKYIKDDIIHLKRNTEKEQSFVSDVYFHADKEPLSILQKFSSGFFDQISPDLNIINQMFTDNTLEFYRPKWKKRGCQLDKTLEPTVFYLGFNMATENFQTEVFTNYRRYINTQLDWDFLCQRIFDGLAQPSNTFLPQSLLPDDFKKINIFPHQEQKITLAPLDKKTFKMIYPKSSSSLAMRFKTWLIRSFEDMGLELIIFEMDFPDMRRSLQKNEHDLFFSGWGADFPDPCNFYMLLYSQNALLKSGGDNTSNFASSQFDQLYDNFENNSIAQLEYLIDDQVPIISAYSPTSLLLKQSWVNSEKKEPFIISSWADIQCDWDQREQVILEENQVPKKWLYFFLVMILFFVYCPRKVSL